MLSLRILTSFLCFSFSIVMLQGNAQEDTGCWKKKGFCCIMRCADSSVASFGGPGFAYTSTEFGGELLYGGEGGAILERGFVLGVFGHGGSSIQKENGDREGISIASGYVGVWIGGYHFKEFPIQPRWGIKAGVGAVELRSRKYEGPKGKQLLDRNVFTLRPELGLGVRIAPWLTLDLSVGYRSVSGLQGAEKFGVSPKGLNGFQGKLALLLGDL